ncbi:MAG: hypothetical protein NC399_01745 [Muribaculum sp.]|nr:hypothetical protein [Muribaculum sp.]
MKKWISGVLAAALLAGTAPEIQAGAGTIVLPEEMSAAGSGTIDGADETWGGLLGDERQAAYQYVVFSDNGGDVAVTIPDMDGIRAIDYASAETIYRVNLSETPKLVFEASVRYGYRLRIPEQLAGCLAEKQERRLQKGRWIYRLELDLEQLSTTKDAPCLVELTALADAVSVAVKGEAVVSGVGADGTAPVGSEVSIKVTKPGYALAMVSRDAKGNPVYTAMELDYDNRYTFTVSESADFVVVDPEDASYAIAYGDSRKAKLTGEAGLRLKSLASSAQGYKEVVLNFTAVPNGSDGTEEEAAYYEVRVMPYPAEGETLPAGSGSGPRYFYIPKVENQNTQSRAVQVNDGDLSAPTACHYEFAVRMVHLDRQLQVPDADTSVEEPLEAALAGNTVVKTFATKNLYYEDKLGFTKKKTTIYSGQENVFAGLAKYSKKASYIHDLTAVAYDAGGGVCSGLTCTFRNDNDELYISAAEDVAPGKYQVVVYAGIGEEATAGSPQGGTMYQANTSFTLTVYAGIWQIDTSGITEQVGVNSKNITFSAVPVGYGYADNQKAKTQKFTYEVYSAVPDNSEFGYAVVEPTDNVRNNISVNKSGKVTVKKGYYVDPDTSNNHIAIVITAADFDGNETVAAAHVEIVSTTLVPTMMRLVKDGKTISQIDAKGKTYGTKITADQAEGARVVVFDQNGNVINQYVDVTPADNAKNTAKVYAAQDEADGMHYLHVRKCASVTLKAVTRDGGKKSKTLKLTISLPSASNITYQLSEITSDGFEIAGNAQSQIKNGEAQLTYNAPRGSVLKLKMGFKTTGGARYYNEWFDLSYTVKGGKIKTEGEYCLVTPSAKTTELKIKIKSGSSVSGTLKLINTGWEDEVYEAAPSLKLINGKLYSNKYTHPLELEEGEDGLEVPMQQLTYQYSYGSFDEIQLAQISKSGPKLFISDFNPAERTFKLNAEPGSDLKPGSYQYKIAFCRDGVLMCKPASVTVKVNKASPVKIAASYTLDLSKGDFVELKCTPSEFLPDFDAQLLNANVGGKANDFNNYFELCYLEDENGGRTKAVIRLKESVTEEEREQLKKTRFTGYVKYNYVYGYSFVENATSKVTIKIK